MLPTEEELWVGEDLQRRSAYPYWQSRSTAPTPNRFAIRIAPRNFTQRPKIVVLHYCFINWHRRESFAPSKDGRSFLCLPARWGITVPPAHPRAHPRRPSSVQRSKRPEKRLSSITDVRHASSAEAAMTKVGSILTMTGLLGPTPRTRRNEILLRSA